jgi:phosphohistidine phosphatase
MDLLIIRHAKAVDGEEMLDALRPLTARGRRDALRVGKALRHAGVQLDAIITSPLVRAVETAELVAVGIHFDDGLVVQPELALGHSVQALVEHVIAPRRSLKAIALVGHEPQLGYLLRGLLRSDAVPSPRKATATRLTWDAADAPAQFQWVYHPDLDAPSTKLADIGSP